MNGLPGATVNWPVPSPSSTVTVPTSIFEMARSALPSPLKSPTAADQQGTAGSFGSPHALPEVIAMGVGHVQKGALPRSEVSRWVLCLLQRDLVGLIARRRCIRTGTSCPLAVSGAVKIVDEPPARKATIAPDAGLKSLRTAAVVIGGIELAEKIKKGQFKIGKLGGRTATMPEIWQAALAE